MQEIDSCDALSILSDPQKLKIIRADGSNFLKRLSQHPLLVRDILDIALRPTNFQRTKERSISPDLPALAVDTLVGLYQDFIDLLAFDRILPKDRALEGLQMDQEESQQVSQEVETPPRQQFQLLFHAHAGIIEGQPEQTSYYYLCRLIGPLSYQRPLQLMRFYQQKPQVMEAIIERMHERGIVQLFCKILECESGKQFFKEYKDQFIAAYFRRLDKALTQGNFHWLEGLYHFYRFLTEKMDEGSDANKYLGLLETINYADLGVLQAVKNSAAKMDDENFIFYLRWVEEMLKHDSYIMGQNNIRLSITYMNRKNSISSNFYKDERPANKKSYHISEDHLLEVLFLLQQSHYKYLGKQSQRTSIQVVIGIYRAVYFLTRVWNLKTKDKQMKQPQLIAQIINQQFFDNTLQTVMKHPRSTILHNCVKELITQCLREEILPPLYFYRNECAYLQLFLNAFPKSKENQNLPFSQQLYQIYKQVVVAEPHVNSQVQTRILQQRQRMSKLIGCDPRKLHADSLRSSSNAFSESSQNMQDMLEFDLHSNHSLNAIGSNKNCGVSLVRVHNTASIQRGTLQEVGEERIVIEGVDEEDDD